MVVAPYAVPFSSQSDMLAHGTVCSRWNNLSQVWHGCKAAAQLGDLGQDLLAYWSPLSSITLLWQHVFHVLDSLVHADAQGKHACHHLHSWLPLCH